MRRQMYTHFKILHTGRTYNTGLKQYTTWKHAQTQIFAFHFIRFTPRKCCCYFKFFKDKFFLLVTHLQRLNLILIVRDYKMYFCELGNTRRSQHYLNIKLFSQFVSRF